MARKCPGCFSPMQVQEFQGVGIDVCQHCGGTWFDDDELRILLKKYPESLAKLEGFAQSQIRQDAGEPSSLFCPDCGVLLQQYRYLYDSPVILNTCPKCGGFWVSDGELAKMQDWRQRAHEPAGRDAVAFALAEASAIHEGEMGRQRNLADLVSVMRVNQPGWFGFLP